VTRTILSLLLVLAGCSQGPPADMASIKEARSTAAEWALVNEQASKGRLTATYVQSMRQAVRDELSAVRSSFSVPDAPYARAVDTLLTHPGDVDPATLRATVEQLKGIEDGLESA
jgi:hypothetical protein